MEIIKSNYFYSKCIWSVAYCNDPKQYIDYLFNSLGLECGIMYGNLCEFLAENSYFLNDSARSNLGFLVGYLKKNLPECSYQKIDFMLSDNSFSLMDGFVLTQYEKRFMYEKAPISLVNSKNKQRYFEILRSIIVNDSDVLITHSSKCDKRTFENNKAPKYANDVLKYIGSVNMIISEKPSIFGDELFLSRVDYVTDLMEKTEKTDNTQKIYTMFRNRIK